VNFSLVGNKQEEGPLSRECSSSSPYCTSGLAPTRKISVLQQPQNRPRHDIIEEIVIDDDSSISEEGLLLKNKEKYYEEENSHNRQELRFKKTKTKTTSPQLHLKKTPISPRLRARVFGRI
jgi:hypothetical protein